MIDLASVTLSDTQRKHLASIRTATNVAMLAEELTMLQCNKQCNTFGQSVEAEAFYDMILDHLAERIIFLTAPARDAAMEADKRFVVAPILARFDKGILTVDELVHDLDEVLSVALVMATHAERMEAIRNRENLPLVAAVVWRPKPVNKNYARFLVSASKRRVCEDAPCCGCCGNS